jgi:toxin-antitoxin system PIN domain toxin
LKLPDVNVLVYAVDEAAAHHETARSWLEEAFGDPEPVALTWPVLLGFLRLATSSAIFPNPLSIEIALDMIDEWLKHPGGEVVGPGRDHSRLLRELLVGARAGGNLTSDAHLAALAIETGSVLVSFDADFHRFDRLRFEHLR